MNNKRVSEWMDGWMDGVSEWTEQMSQWKNRQMSEWVNEECIVVFPYSGQFIESNCIFKIFDIIGEGTQSKTLKARESRN
jgi:hypothetical protein